MRSAAIISRRRAHPKTHLFRVAFFTALLVLLLFSGYAIGRSTLPSPVAASMPPPPVFGHNHGTSPTDANALVGGLSISSHGQTLVPTTTMFTAGVEQAFEFRIVSFDGKPVLKYENTVRQAVASGCCPV